MYLTYISIHLSSHPLLSSPLLSSTPQSTYPPPPSPDNNTLSPFPFPLNHYKSGTRSTLLTTLAGAPTATEKSGTSLVTTLPAPTVHPFPIVTPGMMVVFPPIQQSSPIVTGFAYSIPSRRDCTSVSCVAA
ncbi:hypothetical protein GGS20DRAFT_44171 [Poronia punctata]|nr:hypothetical protein GGS20DRAFT_44171 [Poronia punctata]